MPPRTILLHAFALVMLAMGSDIGAARSLRVDYSVSGRFPTPGRTR